MTGRKTVLLFVGVFLLGLSSLAGGKLSDEQMYPLLNEGNEAFRQANAAGEGASREKLYGKAILNYERIINEGEIKNAKLYYNIGNAYFMKGEVGKAILNYRRAEKLDSGDTNIQKNLAFARSMRIDSVKVKSEQKAMETLLFWHYDFSLKTRFAAACILFGVVCLSLTAIIWFGRGGVTTVTLIIAGILGICFLCSVSVEVYNQANRVCGVVMASEVVARQGDGQNYQASFKEPLHKGTEFDIVERRPGWLHIKLVDGSDGWIPDATADLI